MVFTGSVGLHHVVKGIRSKKYASAPVNDMLHLELKGLHHEDAVQLARNLFAGEQLSTDDELGVARAIASATSCIPYYVQNVVGELVSRRERPATAEDVDEVVQAALFAPTDPWEFRQYRDRITTYYGPEEDVALATLDALSVSNGPIPLSELTHVVRHRRDVDEKQVHAVAQLLQQDHYIRKGPTGLAFAFEIVARSWRAQRDLA